MASQVGESSTISADGTPRRLSPIRAASARAVASRCGDLGPARPSRTASRLASEFGLEEAVALRDLACDPRFVRAMAATSPFAKFWRRGKPAFYPGVSENLEQHEHLQGSRLPSADICDQSSRLGKKLAPVDAARPFRRREMIPGVQAGLRSGVHLRRRFAGPRPGLVSRPGVILPGGAATTAVSIAAPRTAGRRSRLGSAGRLDDEIDDSFEIRGHGLPAAILRGLSPSPLDAGKDSASARDDIDSTNWPNAINDHPLSAIGDYHTACDMNGNGVA